MKVTRCCFLLLALLYQANSHTSSTQQRSREDRIARRRTRSKPIIDEKHAWLSPEEMMEHVNVLSRVAGIPSPRKLVPGYNNVAIHRVHRIITDHRPALLEHIVNLSEFYKGKKKEDRRKVTSKEKVPDVAQHLRRRHMAKLRELADFERRVLQATTLEECADDLMCSMGQEPAICLPFPNDDSDLFGPFEPAYPSGGSYSAAVASIKGGKWSGNAEDRTNADPYAINLIASAAATIADDLADVGCGAIDDDIDICIFFVNIEVPNPFRIICEIANGILSVVALAFATITAQMDYQDALVDGAEIEAAFENSNNILNKQCAIYDAVECRCAQLGVGSGCDGIDSDCDGKVDECDEDAVPPSISTADAEALCKGPFQSLADAEECVRNSVVTGDDCRDVDVTITSSGNLDSAQVTVTATEVDCGKSTSASISTFVDSTSPQVSCSFKKAIIRRSNRLEPAGLTYSVTDNSGVPLNGTVTIYSNEFNRRDAMAYFFENGNSDDRAELFVESEVCRSSGQPVLCIQELDVQYARVYTAIVEATDSAGNHAESECQLQILCPGTQCRQEDISKSVQRFPVASYSSLWG